MVPTYKNNRKLRLTKCSFVCFEALNWKDFLEGESMRLGREPPQGGGSRRGPRSREGILVAGRSPSKGLQVTWKFAVGECGSV